MSASNNAGLVLTGDSWREYALRRMAQPLIPIMMEGVRFGQTACVICCAQAASSPRPAASAVLRKQVPRKIKQFNASSE